MPADRDLALPAPGATRREIARRLGVAGFWRWWLSMLASLVPAGPRTALERRRMRPVVAFDGDVASVWQPRTRNGQIVLVETGRTMQSGDPATVLAEGRKAIAALDKAVGTTPVKVAIALTPRAILRKSLVLPVAVEHDLKQALAYDLDRHTPFKPEELYFDAQVVDRDAARGQIRVDLAAARRSLVDAAIASAAAWGAKVVAVTPSTPPALASTELNLLPAEMRNGTRFARRWQFWLPIVALGVVALTAVVLPVWQKREYAIALNTVAAQAMQQSAVSESLRTQLERQIGDYNFALERKYAYPGAVRVLEDVTHLLPDDTWLTQLELKNASRGKDAQRELSLRGESANAGRLVTLLEDSRNFTLAAPRSPTTKIQPGPGEIFDVGAQLKPLSQPAPVGLAPPEKAAVGVSAPAMAGAPAAGTAAAPAATTPAPPPQKGAPAPAPAASPEPAP
jgi:general secretion pathway protein L